MDSIPKFYEYNEGEPFIHIDKLLNDENHQQLNILADCIMEHVPSHSEYREFNQNKKGYGGGNHVTFLGGFISLLFPQLIEHIKYVTGRINVIELVSSDTYSLVFKA
jgi:hypothetical protein